MLQSPKWQDLIKLNEYLYEIPQSFRADMRVRARFLCTDPEAIPRILKKIFHYCQFVMLPLCPGIQKYAIAMPDIHQGYGFPIGGVGATLDS